MCFSSHRQCLGSGPHISHLGHCHSLLMVSLNSALTLLIGPWHHGQNNPLHCIQYHVILAAKNSSLIPHYLQDRVQTAYQSKRIFTTETLYPLLHLLPSLHLYHAYTMPPGQANILECFESQLKCLELVPTRITAWIILSPWWIMWVDLHPPRQQVSWGSLSELSTAPSWFDWMRPGCVEKIHLILYLHVYPMFTPWNPRKSWDG